MIKLITNENKPKVIQDNGKENIFKIGFKKSKLSFTNTTLSISIVDAKILS
jgi:hypothetical protein